MMPRSFKRSATAFALERLSMPHSFALALGILIVCLWTGDATHAESSKKTLAIVSAEDVDSQAFADLLSAELSRQDGIRLVDSSNTTIGGTVGNTIAFNQSNGVSVIQSPGELSHGNAIRKNHVYRNTGLGIDLNDDGVTPNDKTW